MDESCLNCGQWITSRKTVYEDGTEIVNYTAPNGKGHCGILNLDTEKTFGCRSFVKGEHEVIAKKRGSPWHHFVMIPCPDCRGGSGVNGGACHRCAGTGNVRKYDDGFIGEEQTRLHPKEKELGLAVPLKCKKCGTEVSVKWQHCPECGNRLTPMAETEVIKGMGNQLGM